MADQVGQWTGKIPARTRDELHTDVVALAYTQGMKPDWAESMRFNRYTSHLGDFFPISGTGVLPDPAWSGDLEAMARRAVDWLNEHAPPHRHFRLDDALYCDAA